MGGTGWLGRRYRHTRPRMKNSRAAIRQNTPEGVASTRTPQLKAGAAGIYIRVAYSQLAREVSLSRFK